MMVHDWEPLPGLPAPLPEGETILWQGSPGWRPMARRTFHAGLVLIYFGLLAIWRLDGAEGRLSGAALLAALGLGAAAILCLLAWISARTTIYTITTKRLVMRVGIALPVAANLPFAAIDGAGLRIHRDGSGDIPITLGNGQRAAFLVLWPHVRPWRLSRPQPMLRGLADPAEVARILGRALAAASAQPAPVLGETELPGGTVSSPEPAAV